MDMRATYRDLLATYGGNEAAAKAALDALIEDRREQAKSMPLGELAERLQIPNLKRHAGELVGPCPSCGGTDRFAINPGKGVFNCRVCGANGGSVNLVRHVLACSYGDAIDWMVGDTAVQISDEERAKRRARAEAAERKRLADAARFRRKAIADGKRIWKQAVDPAGTPIADYLAGRGLPLKRFPPTIRYLVRHTYTKKIDGQMRSLHTGPAMIAAVLSPDNKITAVHQTWIDPDNPGKKAKILYGGEEQPAKLVRGSKKGAAIRLTSAQGCHTLIMGEGIETTFSAMRGAPIEGAAYWAGVDLGNLSGIMVKDPTPGAPRWSGIPDMTDGEAFVPPPWIKRLIFVMDGDSHPVMTRAKLESGLRRAMALVPGLTGEIVAAAPGKDLNDMLIEEVRADDEDRLPDS